MNARRVVTVLTMALMIGVGSAFAAELVFTDPVGDDNGPGTYTYPTDQVYTPGSFDLTELKITTKGAKMEIAATVATNLDDPWRMGTGFAVQMIFVFIDTGAPGGQKMGPPGTNVAFADGNYWNKCIILSPQSSSRVKQEVRTKTGDAADAYIVPNRTSGSGKTISASVKIADIGEGDPATWGYQVIMQSNEGFPAKTDLLTRKVNEFGGQHRFGGGSDYDCDPHVMDLLAGKAKGDTSEKDAQHKMLRTFKCNPDGSGTRAVLQMVYPEG